MSEIPLLYKDRRLEGETTLRQCQLAQLHLLHVFHRICEEHGLTYILNGGTALGAAMYGGFIPWDDDVDVAMPLRDYRKFLKIAPKVLPRDVLLPRGSGIVLPFVKLRDAYSVFWEARDDVSMADCCGIFLDVFPLEVYPKYGMKLWLFIAKVCESSWWRRQLNIIHSSRGILWPILTFPKSLMYDLINRTAHGILALARLMLGSGEVALCINHGFRHCRWKKSDIFPPKLIKFEDGEFYGPNKIEDYLTQHYGNWHRIPPPEERPRHGTYITPTQAPLEASWSMEYPKKNSI